MTTGASGDGTICAALLRHAERFSEQRLRGGRAEADEHARLDQRDFGLEPRPARATSPALGFAWIRRLPRGSHLKCFTTLVT